MKTENNVNNNSDKIKSDNSQSVNTNKKQENEKISSKIAIYILASLVFLLIFYIIVSRFIEIRNNKISAEYLNFTTEQNTENYTFSELRVNINTDNIFELTQLDGIGKAKAEAIIEYRKENGDFINIEELKNVTGIGESIFDKIKDNIYVDPPETT